MIYLALGSNLGDRLENLRKAVSLLFDNNVKTLRISPVYQTAAFLPYYAGVEWNKPYLNAAIEVSCPPDMGGFDLLNICKKIEKQMGALHSETWAPRIIDIDIIFFNDEVINSENLKIPHSHFSERAFVLDPLCHLCPTYKPSGYSETILEMAHKNPQHQSVVMGILNITPDSFSSEEGDFNSESFIQILDAWNQANVFSIDIGAEATNSKAEPLTAKQEIERLKPIFEIVKDRKKGIFSPLFSIDTYHFETAKTALESGFDILNDVTGLSNPEMVSLASDFKQVVAMHSLSVPVRQEIIIDESKDILEEVKRWLSQQIETWDKNGLDLNKIIFDPGIGFGKNPSQSLRLIQNISKVNPFGLRNLLGHSRKSFMNVFTGASFANRDIETLAVSLSAREFDLIRVHEPLGHQRALLAKMHCFGQFF